MYITSILLILTPSYSFAYLDPGTGSMILQGILGGITVALVTAKIYWYKVKHYINKVLNKNKKNKK